jgi:hypothetical protein
MWGSTSFDSKTVVPVGYILQMKYDWAMVCTSGANGWDASSLFISAISTLFIFEIITHLHTHQYTFYEKIIIRSYPYTKFITCTCTTNKYFNFDTIIYILHILLLIIYYRILLISLNYWQVQ